MTHLAAVKPELLHHAVAVKPMLIALVAALKVGRTVAIKTTAQRGGQAPLDAERFASEIARHAAIRRQMWVLRHGGGEF